MVYGAAGTGKRVMTSSSSPGISLKQEGISYIAARELTVCLILNVMRGGPGLGTIQPSQSDYFQATKGGGHGDYRMIVLAPASVRKCRIFVKLGFELAFKYANPVLILSEWNNRQNDGKKLNFLIRFQEPPYSIKAGLQPVQTPDRERNIITSLNLDPARQEQHNQKLQAKYQKIA